MIDDILQQATDVAEFCRALIRCGIDFNQVSITFTRAIPHPPLRGEDSQAYGFHVQYLFNSLKGEYARLNQRAEK